MQVDLTSRNEWRNLSPRVRAYIRAYAFDVPDRLLDGLSDEVAKLAGALCEKWLEGSKKALCLGAQHELLRSAGWLADQKSEPRVGLKPAKVGFRWKDDYKYDGYHRRLQVALEVEWTCNSRLLADMVKFEWGYRKGVGDDAVKAGVLFTVRGNPVKTPPEEAWARTGGIQEIAALREEGIIQCPVVLVNFDLALEDK